MPLSLRNPKAKELARKASQYTGKNMTEVVVEALEEYLRRAKLRARSSGLAEEIMDISKRCCSLPDTSEGEYWDEANEEPGVFADGN